MAQTMVDSIDSAFQKVIGSGLDGLENSIMNKVDTALNIMNFGVTAMNVGADIYAGNYMAALNQVFFYVSRAGLKKVISNAKDDIKNTAA